MIFWLLACDPTPAGAPHAEVAADVATYSCPMHPEVQQQGPGDCPKCGMALTPIAKAEKPGDASEIAYYTCPMHPSVQQPGPGSCPLCGMDLTPVTKAERADGAVVVDAGRRAALGIITEAAKRTPLRTRVSLPAVVAWDQSRLSEVTVKVQGWVEDLRVSGPGARVRAGEVLFTFTSPEIVATVEDLAAARHQATEGFPGAAARVDAAEDRLRRWDIPVNTRGERFPVLAPRSGVVIESTVIEGAMVSPGQSLFRIGDLSTVWLEASVPEAQVPRVAAGATVNVRAEGIAPRTGRVARIYPDIDPATRTARVRVDVDNDDLALRPAQWAEVEIEEDAGTPITVPESAVLYTGPRRLVFVDRGQDRLVPQEVEIGRAAEGRVEIVKGLAEGDLVVTSGNFLVAADSRLKQTQP